MLDDDPAPLCPGAQAFFSEDWETGDDGWTRTSQGYATGTVDWENDRNPPGIGPHTIRDFKLVNNLPPGRGVGTAAYATAPPIGQPGGGTCEPGGDFSGSFSIDSPNITIPAGANEPLLVFDHWFAAEAGVDGGQVEISTDNGVTWTLVPKSAFVFNAYNNAYNDIPPLGNNTNPNPNEDAFTAFNVGIAQIGTWGTSIVNLGGLTDPGDTIKIRFLWSQDGCNGVAGW